MCNEYNGGCWGEGLGPVEPYWAEKMRTGDEEYGNECWGSFGNLQVFHDCVLHSKASFAPGYLRFIFNRYSMEKNAYFFKVIAIIYRMEL